MHGRRRMLQLGLTSVVGCNLGADGAGPSGAEAITPRAPALSTPPPRTFAEEVTPFSLCSAFWMNLHHYLYGQAALGEQRVANAEQLAGWRQLPDPERRAWERAIELYRENWSKNDLLFNGTNHQIKQRIAEQESALTIALSEHGAEGLAAALNELAPSYEQTLWADHHQRNLAWGAVARPLIEQHGKALIERLCALFRASWPTVPVRVDRCISANWSGAYTSTRPIHIVVASADERNQGAYALEILFHESSHFMIGALRDALAAEVARQRVVEPPNLWHALLFYASGQAVAERIPGHEMYADRQGLWKGDWAKYRPALAGAWQRYMDGGGSFEEALATLVRSVAS